MLWSACMSCQCAINNITSRYRLVVAHRGTPPPVVPPAWPHHTIFTHRCKQSTNSGADSPLKVAPRGLTLLFTLRALTRPYPGAIPLPLHQLFSVEDSSDVRKCVWGGVWWEGGSVALSGVDAVPIGSNFTNRFKEYRLCIFISNVLIFFSESELRSIAHVDYCSYCDKRSYFWHVFTYNFHSACLLV